MRLRTFARSGLVGLVVGSLCAARGAHAQSDGTATPSRLAAQMLAYARSTDPVALGTFMWTVDGWRDSTLFEAAIRLATDTTAAPTARVFGVWHLLLLTHPYMLYTYAGLTAGDSTSLQPDGSEVTTVGCREQIGSEMADRVVTPLPPDYAARIQKALSLLVAAPGTPTIVRNAARCAK